MANWADRLAKLAQALATAGTVPAEYVAFAGAKAYNSTTQSIADATSTPVTFDSEEYDSGAFHSTVTNTSRFTIPAGKGGVYSLKAGITLAFATSAVLAQLWFRVDGTTSARAALTWLPRTNSAAIEGFTISSDVQLAAGQYVELMIYQDSTGARNIGHATLPDFQSFMAVALLGT